MDLASKIDISPALKAHIAFHGSSKTCAELLQSIPEWKTLRNSIDLTKNLLALIISVYKATDAEREEIVVSVLTRAFQLSEDEIKTVRGHLQFIKDNKMVKKITKSRRLYRWLFKRSKK